MGLECFSVIFLCQRYCANPQDPNGIQREPKLLKFPKCWACQSFLLYVDFYRDSLAFFGTHLFPSHSKRMICCLSVPNIFRFTAFQLFKVIFFFFWSQLTLQANLIFARPGFTQNQVFRCRSSLMEFSHSSILVRLFLDRASPPRQDLLFCNTTFLWAVETRHIARRYTEKGTEVSFVLRSLQRFEAAECFPLLLDWCLSRSVSRFSKRL